MSDSVISYWFLSVDLGRIVIEDDDNNLRWISISKIKFLVKINTRTFNTALDRIYKTEILIVPGFYTAFYHILNK